MSKQIENSQPINLGALTQEQLLEMFSSLDASKLAQIVTLSNQAIGDKSVKPQDIEVHEIMKRAVLQMATGKEVRYFWELASRREQAQNMLKTFCALAAAQKVDEKITTEAGTYEVKDYVVPSFPWITTFTNFSHRVYASPAQYSNSNYLEISERPNNWMDLPGRVLSPSGLKETYKVPAENNPKWGNVTTITKNPVHIGTVNGVFNNQGQYKVWDESKDILTGQALGLTHDGIAAYMGDHAAIASIESLVDELCQSNSTSVNSNTSDTQTTNE